MKHRLYDTLAALGVSGMAEADAWRRLIMVRNFTPVPAPPGAPSWGFKFLLLDERGEPAWFGRCGWGSREIIETEVALLEALGRDPVTAAHVPESRIAAAGVETVQISRHLRQPSYHVTGKLRAAAQWAADVTEILIVAERVMARVYEQAAGLFPRDPTAFRRQQFTTDCALLQQRGVDAACLEQWRELLQPLLDTMPPVLQHGDLWSANVLRAEGRWWLIDFSECGMVWMTGYDMLLMLVNSPRGFSTSWIAPTPGAPLDDLDRARREVMAAFAARHGLSAEQVGRLILYFMVRLTAYRMRPGVPAHLSDHWRAEIARVEAFLAAGHSLAALTLIDGPEAE